MPAGSPLDRQPLPLQANPLTDFGALAIDDSPITKPDSIKDLKKKEYNDKLAENRKKMEQAEEDEKRRELEEKRSNSPDTEEKVYQSLLNPGYDSPGVRSPEMRSRSSSPLARGSPIPQQKQEQFLSGHLLLAKKLSDEAEQKKMKQKMDDKDQFRCNSPLVTPFIKHSHSSHSMTAGAPVFQTIPSNSDDSQHDNQPLKQKLSRQLSLQGSQDPRLQPGHTTLRQHMSLDPRLYSDQMQTPHRQQPLGPSRSVGLPCSRDISNRSPLQSNFFTKTEPEEERHHPSLQIQNTQDNRLLHVSDHSALTRMQSDPETPRLNNIQQVFEHKMRRQNSNSDTQLHMIGTEMDTVDPFFSPAPGDLSNYRNRNYNNFNPQPPAHISLGNPAFSHADQQNILHNYAMTSQAVSQSHRHQAGNTTWTFAGQTLGPAPTIQGVQGRQLPQHPPQPAAYQQLPMFMTREEAIWSGRRQSLPVQNLEQNYPSFQVQGHQPLGIHPQLSLGSQGHHPLRNQVQGQQTQRNIDQGHGHPALRGHQSLGQVHRPLSSSRSHQTLGSHDPMNLASNVYLDQRNTDMMVQGQSARNDPIADICAIETENRHKLFYHLCALFPEAKVKEVMNKYPNINDAQELCAYIIGAK